MTLAVRKIIYFQHYYIVLYCVLDSQLLLLCVLSTENLINKVNKQVSRALCKLLHTILLTQFFLPCVVGEEALGRNGGGGCPGFDSSELSRASC